MVLLQWYSSRAYRHICRNLHSNMVLLQWSDSIGARRNNSWFTFQYGSTSIRVEYESIVIFKIFTFQYGSTSIRTSSMFLAALSNLHSNMVLLQLILLPRTHVLSCYLHSNMVLLQSGCDHTVSCAFEIYIPIWFYFNSTSAVRSIFKVLIYIPIWFYFNTTRRLNILSWRHLHSNMVLLQSTADHHHQTLFFIYIPIWFYFNIDFFNSCFFLTSFTFQYGSTSIKLACRRNNVFSGIYIPIWFYFNSLSIA